MEVFYLGKKKWPVSNPSILVDERNFARGPILILKLRFLINYTDSQESQTNIPGFVATLRLSLVAEGILLCQLSVRTAGLMLSHKTSCGSKATFFPNHNAQCIMVARVR